MLKEIIWHVLRIYCVLGTVAKHFTLLVSFNPLNNIKRERKLLSLLHRVGN